MFTEFFYLMRDSGLPVSPTAFLRFQKALAVGEVNSLEDFYITARSTLVKSERYFDLFDQLFAHHFEGAELPDLAGIDLDAAARAMLEQWLQNPEEIARALGEDPEKLQQMSPDELIQYFMDRLKEQTEAHHGGNRWIGTGGTSPVGHSGVHPGGMRVGGVSRNKSAIKVAMDRRYRDYSQEGPLTQSQMAEALKRLRRLIPTGPRDQVNIDKTIRETVKNAGEIEIVFDRSLKDRLKVIIMIDNGGWSMEPYVEVVQTLFNYARAQFKDLKTYFFHNTIYDVVWSDPPRIHKPQRLDEFVRFDSATRLIVVGDASMAPYELMATDGSIHLEERSGRPSIERLKQLTDVFPHSVWLNPKPAFEWPWTRTIGLIANIFPMYELTLDGLEKAVAQLMSKN
jgi:hypothetical protein